MEEQTASNTNPVYGYNGILRVDLSRRKTTLQSPDAAVLRKFVGGATLGIKYLYDEVPASVNWNDPENRLYIFSGPLGGTRVSGSGSICIVSKGALTNGVASTQANGFFGAFLRFAGYDGIVLQGAADKWVYLYIHDNTVEIRDAGHLLGKDTFEIEEFLKADLGENNLSVLSIGPAGEHMVRFASICTDMGHIAAHNGVGAVMGSKKVKAIVIKRGPNATPFYDKEGLSRSAKEINDNMLVDMFYKGTAADGTIPAIAIGTKVGFVPVKNYTSNVNFMTAEKLDTYSVKNVRLKFKEKPSPCWACASTHCHKGEVPDGKYAGRILEEPEYEGLASCSMLVGIDDVTTSMVLANQIDRLGMDTNESGWVMSWVMECYQKGFLTKEDTDGLEMTWGNGEAVMAMLHKIANREGFGNLLAEGVMRAARYIGGETTQFAIHSLKGNTPRSHDHRMVWLEMFDTCVSNTGTLEAHNKAPYKQLGMPPTFDVFDPLAVSTVDAKIKGAMVFEDSMVTCRYRTATALDLLSKAINAATGWDMDFQESMTVGRRAVNLARVYNLRAGIGAELDAPSTRYGSTLTDGIGAGRGIMPHWNKMIRNYYNIMGWDEATGVPLPKTLTDLGLDFVIPDLPKCQQPVTK
jgi:aldehyde:ferredoxin oxidoreductase